MKRTKIVCTLGPASDSVATVEKLIKSGMNVARLNLSHNTLEYHGRLIKTVRTAARATGEPAAILLDLQGPRIRIGDLGDKIVNLKIGQNIILTEDVDYSKAGDKKIIPVAFANFSEAVKPGQRILIADGLIELKVKSIENEKIHCETMNGGAVSSHKGINLPDTAVKIPSLTEKDKKDLAFGLKNGVDYVGLSFVSDANDVNELRSLINKLDKNPVPAKIIVKIERKAAIDNIDEIIEAADGVMVARGDLGIELPEEDVPLMQKMIIDKCLHAAKPVIVATQMLDSMINNPRPTRAEVSDVANAVIDHTDAVMLSGETANGKYPVEATEMMKKIIVETENSVYDNLVLQDKVKKIIPASEAIGLVAKTLSENSKAKLILADAASEHTARIVSRYRPEMPILVSCANERSERQLNLSWGIAPFVLLKTKDPKESLAKSMAYAKKKKLAKAGDKIIVATDNSVEVKAIG
ncbi:MAG: pyruvate kinase [Parcubacteria group bacterium]